LIQIIQIPPRKEIYSLFEEGGEVLVNHLVIKEFPGNASGEIKFSCGGEKRKYFLSYGAIEEMILSKDPDAFIVKEPFLCCSRNILNSSTCIQDLFLKSYLKKRNLKKIEDPLKGFFPLSQN